MLQKFNFNAYNGKEFDRGRSDLDHIIIHKHRSYPLHIKQEGNYGVILSK